MKPDPLQAVLSEYGKLRDEIQRRSNNQLFCITVSIASSGVLLGLLIEDVASRLPILLIIPSLLVIFGLIFLDHHDRIFELGHYISEEIENKKLDMIFEKSNIKWIGWESILEEKRKKSIENKKPLSLIATELSFLYFTLPSVFSVVIYAYYRFFKYGNITQVDVIDIILYIIFFATFIFIGYFINKYYKSKKKIIEYYFKNKGFENGEEK